MRIAHLSDPHFSRFSYSLTQFLSKRWIGNFNFLLFRKLSYKTKHLWALPQLLQNLLVENVFITGDFSSTSLKSEFEEGMHFIEAFRQCGLPTYFVPGNHDCYTRATEKKQSFYNTFVSQEMREKGLETKRLGQGWHYIGLDCALATPPFCSFGKFLAKTETHLRETLSRLDPSENVILANHFPLYTTERPLHDLKRAHELQELLSAFPQVKLYLHGHDHAPYIIQRPNMPLVLNAGSCAQTPLGGIYILDLFQNDCLVQRMHYDRGSWTIEWQKHYNFQSD